VQAQFKGKEREGKGRQAGMFKCILDGSILSLALIDE
jgi:hypothetical protein